MKKVRETVRDFFFPRQDAPPWRRILPYAVLGVLTLGLLSAGAAGWEYTNSPTFCGTQCHTMPPEYTAYLTSPHARIDCVECHIGRDVISVRVTRKAGDIKHIVSLVFKTYQFPITADELRPARETCERCHFPEKFSDDSLREIKHFGTDRDNLPTSIYLVLKTGGGARRQGLGRGIHWHIENRIQYYATDKTEQTIPYVRVYNEDGTVDEYTDLAAGIDPASISESDLREMDCITCHNRITHLINPPEVSVDKALSNDTIDRSIPEIRLKGVEVLRAKYESQQQALNGIAGLEGYYQVFYPDYYASHRDRVQAAVASLQEIYTQSVFEVQKADWNSHPNNVGHQNSPGCFRCHDGKHLNAEREAIRLECNLCHSIPVVAGAQDFVSDIEISRGPEPQSHLNPNWIALHRTRLDDTCALCHNTANPGGSDNTSFCSNSACHGTVWQYAGFDAPALTAILAELQPPAEPVAPAAPVVGVPTYLSNVQPLFETRCGMCHGDGKAAGLKLTAYADALAGSANGPVILPGDADGSKLVQVQSGQHFANFSDKELELVKEWIAEGAPEE